jgi:hypothetical protein
MWSMAAVPESQSSSCKVETEFLIELAFYRASKWSKRCLTIYLQCFPSLLQQYKEIGASWKSCQEPYSMKKDGGPEKDVLLCSKFSINLSALLQIRLSLIILYIIQQKLATFRQGFELLTETLKCRCFERDAALDIIFQVGSSNTYVSLLLLLSVFLFQSLKGFWTLVSSIVPRFKNLGERACS